ncbi:hypothetical protein LCGC14_0235250 [marine sediment metagenome]|uniref:RecF/RecN/SMC N-terminal domain-containing protein n=1 Tax=marine sediment metagenome TaxID=412755 RepID=A0A0F9UDD6_9ZZZZ
MTNLQQHSEFLIKTLAERDRLQQELDKTSRGKENALSGVLLSGRARDIVNSVLVLTQEKVCTFVEDVVSLALSVVYGDEYKFELEFDVKRNQSEATPWILKDGDRFSPREEVGGGVLDVTSLSLRFAFWSLMVPKPAPVFILDEPGRFLSRDKQGQFGRMLKELSEMLGVQIIMVSHSTDIIEQADKAYEVVQENGVSKCLPIGEMA